MPETEETPRVADNPEEQRFEARMGGVLAGIAEYRLRPGRIVFTHTAVEAEFEGQGVASRLAAVALDDARSRGLKVTPACPFIAAYIRRHKEYAELVAPPRSEER